MKKNGKIGVIDSGVGGLTVVKYLQQLLPEEDIVYFGDTIRCPYGNRSAEEIIAFTNQMIFFLEQHEIKAVVLACNTISVLWKEIQDYWEYPLFGIIEPTVAYLRQQTIKNIGILGTVFTVQSGIYQELLEKDREDIFVVGQGCKGLAGLIEEDNETLEPVLKQEIQSMQREKKVDTVVLACSHYPLVLHLFEKNFPHISFLDPAYFQGLKVKAFFHGLDQKQEKSCFSGTLQVYTTGELEIFSRMIHRLNIGPVAELRKVTWKR